MYTIAAIAAPIRGAAMNSQTCVIGTEFPTNELIKAGPKLLAGFTDVPVSGIPKICTRVKVKPITRPAIELFSLFDVTPKTAITNTKVKMISTANACVMLIFKALPAAKPLAPKPEFASSKTIRTSAPAIPPRN